MPWKFISKLEIHDRQVHASPEGTEVINTYYVEPASAGCVVISNLLGAVLFDGGLDASGTPKNPTLGHRILPATDYQYGNCYCVDAYETMIHPMQSIGTASLIGPSAEDIGVADEWDTIRQMLESKVVLNGPQSLNDNFTKNSTDPTQGPRLGVYIRAVFRPLITVYKYGNLADADYRNADVRTFPFDYIDLRINPMSRVIPASAALYGVTNTGLGFGIAAQGAAEQVDSWLQISIRRVMCPNIPVQTIAVLKNKINGARYDNADDKQTDPLGYTPSSFEVPGLVLPVPVIGSDPLDPTHISSIVTNLTQTKQTFPVQTLRFDDAVWEKKVIQSCIDQDHSTIDKIVILQDADGVPFTEPMTWYNGELVFSWRTVMDNWYPSTYDPTNSVRLPDLNIQPPDPTGHRVANYGWITWNCDWLPGGMGVSLQGLTKEDILKAFVPIIGGGIVGLAARALRRYPTGWYELASWQGMGIHGNLTAYDFTKIAGGLFSFLGTLYLQFKYWDDNDIRLRGGTASGWNADLQEWKSVTPTGIGDMLPLLNVLPNCTPFDLLFKMNAP